MPEEEETAVAADWSPYFGVQSPPFRRLVPAALDEDVLPDNENEDISEDEGGGGSIQRSLDSLQALADSLTSIGQVQREQVRHVVFVFCTFTF
jgi:hypothetical protein